MRVHIGHHFYGAGNLGDDLMLAGFLRACREVSDYVQLSCATPFHRDLQARRFPEIEWLPLEAREDAIRNCDVWLGLGGPAFETDTGFWMVEHLDAERSVCDRHQKPMYFLCVGVSNLEALHDARAIAVIEQSEHIWTRDRHVATYLGDSGHASKVTAGADLSHIQLSEMSISPPAEPGSFGWLWHYDHPQQIHLDTLLELLERTSSSPSHWLVQEVRELPGSEMATWRALSASARGRLQLCVPDYGARSVEGLLSAWPACEVVVTSRFHCALYYAWAGARVVILERNQKLRWLAATLGCRSTGPTNDTERLYELVTAAREVPRELLRRQRDTAVASCREFFYRIGLVGSPA